MRALQGNKQQGQVITVQAGRQSLIKVRIAWLSAGLSKATECILLVDTLLHKSSTAWHYQPAVLPQLSSTVCTAGNNYLSALVLDVWPGLRPLCNPRKNACQHSCLQRLNSELDHVTAHRLDTIEAHAYGTPCGLRSTRQPWTHRR